jgi:excisionase family DNA binding protein
MAYSSRKPINSEFTSILSFEPLLDSDEAAALLKIHPKTLQKMARTGEIVGVQVGKLWRFRGSQLDKWLQSKIAS